MDIIIQNERRNSILNFSTQRILVLSWEHDADGRQHLFESGEIIQPIWQPHLLNRWGGWHDGDRI